MNGLDLFQELFSGRTDVYGMKEFCMKEPLTKKIYEDHLKGEQRIGVYPITDEKFTKWIAIDLDEDNFEKALEIKRQCEHYKLKPLIERSKSKGFHIWIWFEKKIEAYKPRLVIEQVLNDLNIKAEIFPKSDETNKQIPYGNFIFIPIYGNDTKDNRTVFIDEEEHVIISSPADLSKIKLTKAEIIDEVIEINNLKREELRPRNGETKAATGALPCIEAMKKAKMKAGEGRNEVAFRLAIYFKEHGLSSDDIKLLLVNWNSKNIDSLQARELATIINSVFKGKYKSYGCDSAIIQPFCDREECPIAQAEDRKKRIEQGIITLTFRNPEVMVFKKKNYEFRVQDIDIAKSGEMKGNLTLTKDNKFVTKEFINFNKAVQREKIAKRADDEEINFDIVKIEELVKKQLEKEEKEKLEKKKQLYVMTEEEKTEALDFLENTPNLLYEVTKLTNEMGVVGEEALRLMVYLCYTSRITSDPLSITVKGESSSGKSFLCESVQKLIPDEGRYFISQATQQAFFHLPEDGLQHKIVFIAEQPGAERADYSIRTAQSEKNLTLMIPVKNPQTGDIETQVKIVKGPVGFLMTTTKASLFDENETRNFSIYTDDSPKLTKKIHQITVRQALGESFEIDARQINLMKNIQRLLNADFKVVIPFGREVFSAFPNEPVRIRRDAKKFRVMIEVITLLHQFKRKQIKTDGKVILEATVADYYLAKLIAGKILLHTIYEVGPASMTIWEGIKTLKEQYIDKGKIEDTFSFTYRDLTELTTWKYQKVKKWVLTLLKAGHINYKEISAGGKGKTAEFQIAKREKQKTDEEGDDISEVVFLPSVELLVKDYPCDSTLFYHPFSGQEVDPFVAEAPDELKMVI